MRVFIDFDYTLCNTVLLKEDIAAVAQAHAVELISLPESRETYNRIGHYTLRKHLELSQCPVDRIVAIEADFFSRASRWLYSDAIEFFTRNAHHDISILSYGDVDFQQRKIESSGIAHYAQHVLCTPDTKVETLKKYVQKNEPFIIIDDRAYHLNAVHEAFLQAQCVRILRTESPYLNEISTYAMKSVNDLSWSVDGV